MQYQRYAHAFVYYYHENCLHYWPIPAMNMSSKGITTY